MIPASDSASVQKSDENSAHIACNKPEEAVTGQPQFLLDCAALSSMALRGKYPIEANSHRAMLSRRKSGAVVASSLFVFRDFLRHVGPCPQAGYTIDRLNNDDPEYAPGKIAWRSKLDQTRNRSNTVFLTDFDGTKRSVPEWAALTGQSEDTLYSRRRRKWTDPEVIHGRAFAAATSPHSIWPKGREAQWDEAYRRGAQGLTVGRHELRAEFLLRICRTHYRELMEIVEGLVPPGIEAGPEHNELFKDVHGWRREIQRAAALLAQPGYRESQRVSG